MVVWPTPGSPPVPRAQGQVHRAAKILEMEAARPRVSQDVLLLAIIRSEGPTDLIDPSSRPNGSMTTSVRHQDWAAHGEFQP